MWLINLSQSRESQRILNYSRFISRLPFTHKLKVLTMGKKRRRQWKDSKEEKMFSHIKSYEWDVELDQGAKRGGVKQLTKRNKVLLKRNIKMKLRQEMHLSSKNEERDRGVKDKCGFQKVKVFVKDDEKIDKAFLLSSIGNYVDHPFCPLGYFRGSDSITFYFDGGKDIADAIHALHNRIPTPSGELMGIKVSFVDQTDVVLNCTQIEILKTVIAQRFSSSSGLLDLSALHLDPLFLENNIFLPLMDPGIFKQVLIIIRDNQPSVQALNLNNNKLGISSLKLFDDLLLRLSSLSAINLESNNIKNIQEIRYLRSLPLKELKLIGNPFTSDKRSSSPKYIKTIKKELPFLKVLDGLDITLVKSFPNLLYPSPLRTIETNSTPQCASINNPVENIDEATLKTFLQQFYTSLDSPEKMSLLQAYTTTAQIEIKSENALISSARFEGEKQIMEFLQSWPVTLHDYATFNLEILSISSEYGIVCVSGACHFKEMDVSIKFKRTMKIIPFNSGFCCAEDLLEIV